MIPRYVSAEEAVSTIRSGDRVFIQSVAAAPQRLIAAMTARAGAEALAAATTTIH